MSCPWSAVPPSLVDDGRSPPLPSIGVSSCCGGAPAPLVDGRLPP